MESTEDFDASTGIGLGTEQENLIRFYVLKTLQINTEWFKYLRRLKLHSLTFRIEMKNGNYMFKWGCFFFF